MITPSASAVAKKEKEPAEAKSAFGPVPTDPQVLAQRVLNGFQSAIDPIEVPTSYHLSLLASAAVLVLLVVMYLGLIAAIAWGLYYHAIYSTGIFAVAGSGRGGAFALLIYAVPLLAGAIVLLFLVKPLFNWESDSTETRNLDKHSEPLLFAFIERLCTAVGAPVPAQIKVDADINASAGFRLGILSMLGNDLVLTIGLPLAAGLNLRQFAGVLAHEFGHFTQGTGMRLSYLVRSISFWFVRVVYERDSWDEWLDNMGSAGNGRLILIVWVIQFFVGASRFILWLLLMAGQLVVGYLLREMEYDADRHETRLAGSDTFESTCRKISLLQLAYRGAIADLREFYRDGKLGDDLPRLIVANVKQVPKKIRQELDKAIDESETGLFDTHPSDRERISQSKLENAAGVFRMDWPASVLFSNFPQLCREVTWDYYQGIFGNDLKASDVHPLGTLLDQRDREMEDFKAAERYFQGAVSLLRPLHFGNFAISPPLRPDLAQTQLGALRARVLGEKDSYIKLLEEYREADQLEQHTMEAIALVYGGARPPFQDNPIMIYSPNDASAAQAHVVQRKQELALRMVDFEKMASARLASCLQLLQLPSIGERMPDAAGARAEAGRLYSTLVTISAQLVPLIALRNDNIALNATCSLLPESGDVSHELIRMIRHYMENCREGLKGFHERLGADPYPFEHGRGKITLSDYAVQTVPGYDDLEGTIYGARGAVDNLMSCFARSLGRLAAIAEQVEVALGMPKLPDIEHPEDEV